MKQIKILLFCSIFFLFSIYSNLFADERIDKCLELEELRGKNSGITYEENIKYAKKICGIRARLGWSTKKAENFYNCIKIERNRVKKDSKEIYNKIIENAIENCNSLLEEKKRFKKKLKKQEKLEKTKLERQKEEKKLKKKKENLELKKLNKEIRDLKNEKNKIYDHLSGKDKENDSYFIGVDSLISSLVIGEQSIPYANDTIQTGRLKIGKYINPSRGSFLSSWSSFGEDVAYFFFIDPILKFQIDDCQISKISGNQSCLLHEAAVRRFGIALGGTQKGFFANLGLQYSYLNYQFEYKSNYNSNFFSLYGFTQKNYKKHHLALIGGIGWAWESFEIRSYAGNNLSVDSFEQQVTARGDFEFTSTHAFVEDIVIQK